MHTRAIAGDNEKRKFILFNVLLLFSNFRTKFLLQFSRYKLQKKKTFVMISFK